MIGYNFDWKCIYLIYLFIYLPTTMTWDAPLLIVGLWQMPSYTSRIDDLRQ